MIQAICNQYIIHRIDEYTMRPVELCLNCRAAIAAIAGCARASDRGNPPLGIDLADTMIAEICDVQITS